MSSRGGRGWRSPPHPAPEDGVGLRQPRRTRSGRRPVGVPRGEGSVSEAGSTIKEIAAEQIREAGKEKKEAAWPASGRDTRNHRGLSAGAGRNHHRVRRPPGREVGRPERPVVRDVVATPDSGSAARDRGRPASTLRRRNVQQLAQCRANGELGCPLPESTRHLEVLPGSERRRHSVGA